MSRKRQIYMENNRKNFFSDLIDGADEHGGTILARDDEDKRSVNGKNNLLGLSRRTKAKQSEGCALHALFVDLDARAVRC